MSRPVVEESGPLFVRYRVTYTFQKGQQYAVVLTLDHNERHVTVDEFLGGVAPQDEAYLEIDMAGVDPDYREVMTNGGYGAQGYCGAFDKKLGEDGLIEVPDARDDARFADNPMVTGEPHVRFYSSIILKVGAGHRSPGWTTDIRRFRFSIFPNQIAALSPRSQIYIFHTPLPCGGFRH